MALTDAYSLPLAAPLYPEAPPWYYRDCSLVVVPFRTAPGATRRLVPAPLEPNDDDLVLAMIGPMHNHALGSTHEAFIAVPSRLGDLWGNYAVFLYLANDACITSGREIWGWPKKEASFAFEEQDGRVVARCERAGVELIRAEIAPSAPAAPADLELSPTWFNFKLIPSVSADAPPDVKQITATTFDNVVVHEAAVGPASVTFASIPGDPLADLLPVLEVLGGVLLRRFGLDLLHGTVVHDYLADGVSRKEAQAPVAVGVRP